MSIYVGNLSHQASEDDLRGLFNKFGEVSSVKVMKDNFTGQSRGFAFVDMLNSRAAEQAISELNQTEFMQRTLTVNEAKPKTASNSFSRNKGSDNY